MVKTLCDCISLGITISQADGKWSNYDFYSHYYFDDGSLLKNIVFMLLGIGLIVAGGQAVVNSAKEISYSFGMSETLVGLTIVAVGTSLPELVTSIVAQYYVYSGHYSGYQSDNCRL